MNEIINTREFATTRFEAYVSINVPSPLTEIIYAIREGLGDRKMSVMPVDIPLFGHFDDKMILMRHFKDVSALLDETIYEINRMEKDTSSVQLKLGAFDYSPNNELVLHVYKNRWLDDFMEMLLRKSYAAGLTFIGDLKAVKDYIKDVGGHDPLYIYISSGPVQKIGQDKDFVLGQDLVLKKAIKKINEMDHIEVKGLTFYQKEAVPLTRLESWDVSS